MANEDVVREDGVDLIYETNEKGERVLVRSLQSTQRAYLRFTNHTGRPVNVWWRDFRGQKQLYVCIQPGKFYDINSFITHPWEFTDASTGDAYVINNNPIYRAPKNVGGMMFRTNWNVTVSVRTLRHIALMCLATHVDNTDLVVALGLPRMLADDLTRLIESLRIEKPLATQPQ